MLFVHVGRRPSIVDTFVYFQYLSLAFQWVHVLNNLSIIRLYACGYEVLYLSIKLDHIHKTCHGTFVDGAFHVLIMKFYSHLGYSADDMFCFSR